MFGGARVLCSQWHRCDARLGHIRPCSKYTGAQVNKLIAPGDYVDAYILREINAKPRMDNVYPVTLLLLT